jgi:hypothetical protein
MLTGGSPRDVKGLQETLLAVHFQGHSKHLARHNQRPSTEKHDVNVRQKILRGLW